jgi:hypothetical protein
MSDDEQLIANVLNATARQRASQLMAQSELPAPAGSAFNHARLNDPTVAVMLEMGKSLEAIIGQLASEKKQYLKRIVELECIAPRKIVLPGGGVMVWRCPDELVP